jgi:hypothetical protein
MAIIAGGDLTGRVEAGSRHIVSEEESRVGTENRRGNSAGRTLPTQIRLPRPLNHWGSPTMAPDSSEALEVVVR